MSNVNGLDIIMYNCNLALIKVSGTYPALSSQK